MYEKTLKNDFFNNFY